jgi:hypothetical protein
MKTYKYCDIVSMIDYLCSERTKQSEQKQRIIHSLFFI